MGNQIKTFMWLAFLAGAGCNENVYDAQKSRCLFDEECQAPSVCHPMYHTCTAPAPDANSVDQAVDAEGPDLQAAIDSTAVTSSDADIEPLDRGQDPADTQVPLSPMRYWRMPPCPSMEPCRVPIWLLRKTPAVVKKWGTQMLTQRKTWTLPQM